MPQEITNINFNEQFGNALSLQQAEKWDEALAAYQQILGQGRDEMSYNQASVVYHNMSAAAHAKADHLKAYIWSKKAFHLNSSNLAAKESFDFYAKKVEIPNIPHQISNFDNFKKVISFVASDAWVILSLVLILTTTWLTLKRIVTLKRNKLNDIFDQPNTWPVYILSIFAIISVFTACIAYKEDHKQTALVIAEKAAVQTVPGENKPVIFEAAAGLELEVLRKDKEYVQVRYPGAFTGWVKLSQLEPLSLNFWQAK